MTASSWMLDDIFLVAVFQQPFNHAAETVCYGTNLTS